MTERRHTRYYSEDGKEIDPLYHLMTAVFEAKPQSSAGDTFAQTPKFKGPPQLETQYDKSIGRSYVEHPTQGKMYNLGFMCVI